MLGRGIVRDGQCFTSEALRVIVHPHVSEARTRDVLGRCDEALSSGDHLEVQGVLHHIGLHQVEILPVACRINALTGQNSIDRRRKHQHVLVEAQLDIRHSFSYPQDASLPMIPC